MRDNEKLLAFNALCEKSVNRLVNKIINNSHILVIDEVIEYYFKILYILNEKVKYLINIRNSYSDELVNLQEIVDTRNVASRNSIVKILLDARLLMISTNKELTCVNKLVINVNKFISDIKDVIFQNISQVYPRELSAITTSYVM